MIEAIGLCDDADDIKRFQVINCCSYEEIGRTTYHGRRQLFTSTYVYTLTTNFSDGENRVQCFKKQIYIIYYNVHIHLKLFIKKQCYSKLNREDEKKDDERIDAIIFSRSLRTITYARIWHNG